ncbi:hypothetical protein Tco_0421485 [Tanacetum coccineum]
MIHLHCDYRSFTEITYLPRRELCFFCILDSLFLMVDIHHLEASSDFIRKASSDLLRDIHCPIVLHQISALSPVRADLIPSPKRVRDSGYLTDVEVDHRETSLRDDAIVRVSDEPHLEQDSDPEIHAEIDECFAYADCS